MCSTMSDGVEIQMIETNINISIKVIIFWLNPQCTINWVDFVETIEGKVEVKYDEGL